MNSPVGTSLNSLYKELHNLKIEVLDLRLINSELQEKIGKYEAKYNPLISREDSASENSSLLNATSSKCREADRATIQALRLENDNIKRELLELKEKMKEERECHDEELDKYINLLKKAVERKSTIEEQTNDANLPEVQEDDAIQQSVQQEEDVEEDFASALEKLDARHLNSGLEAQMQQMHCLVELLECRMRHFSDLQKENVNAMKRQLDCTTQFDQLKLCESSAPTNEQQRSAQVSGDFTAVTSLNASQMLSESESRATTIISSPIMPMFASSMLLGQAHAGDRAEAKGESPAASHRTPISLRHRAAHNSLRNRLMQSGADKELELEKSLNLPANEEAASQSSMNASQIASDFRTLLDNFKQRIHSLQCDFAAEHHLNDVTNIIAESQIDGNDDNKTGADSPSNDVIDASGETKIDSDILTALRVKRDENEALRNRINCEIDANRALQSQCATLERNLCAANATTQSLRDEMTQSDTQRQRLTSQLDAALRELEDLAKEHRVVISTNQELTNQAELANTQLSELEAQRAAQSEEWLANEDSLRAMLSDLIGRMQNAVERHAGDATAAGEAGGDREEAAQLIDQLFAKIARKNAQISALAANQEKLRNSHTDAMTQLRAQMEELCRVESQMKTLKNGFNTLQSKYASKKADLKKAQELIRIINKENIAVAPPSEAILSKTDAE